MLISKELYLDRPLSSGLFPVVIRVSHLGKVKIIHTSVCCHRKHWDRHRNAINRRDVAFTTKNGLIDAIYRRISGKIQEYIDRTLSENLDTLLNSKEVNGVYEAINPSPPDAPETLGALIRQKIDSLKSLNTRRGYESFLRYFVSRFGEGPFLKDISLDFFAEFRETLERDYPVTSTMRRIHTAHLYAVINAGKEAGVISRDLKFKPPLYPILSNGREIPLSDLSDYYSLLKRKMKRDPKLRLQENMALALFILNIAFQGLAPTDFARLRVGDITFANLPIYNKESSEKIKTPTEREEVVVVNTFRQKTKQPVKIVTISAPIKAILRVLMNGKGENEFLLPCFDHKREYSPDQRQNRLANFFHKLSISLNSILRKNGLGATTTNITFYFARHAFCNLVDSLDIPRHLIQYLIGHRVSVLERSYLRQISPSEQALISKRIFQILQGN